MCDGNQEEIKLKRQTMVRLEQVLNALINYSEGDISGAIEEF